MPYQTRLIMENPPPLITTMEDLDVAQLAAYLHLLPDQVTKMAMRGRLPGRKVGGEWRFSEAEIHHWLEARIGASDQEELDQFQQVLDRATPEAVDRPIHELCPIDAIEVPLNARTRGSVIRSMCDLASKTGLMWDAPAMAEAVAAREQMHPTALDCGVALLHPRRPQTSILADSVVSLAVCSSSIPFSDRGQMTDIFFLICSYDDTVHLRILAKLSRMITGTNLLEQLRSAGSPTDAWHAIKESEESIDD